TAQAQADQHYQNTRHLLPPTSGTTDLHTFPFFADLSRRALQLLDSAEPAPVPGGLDPRGVRYFTSNRDGEIYGGQVLDAPRHPHGFTNLPQDQQEAVYAYTKNSVPYNWMLRATGIQDKLNILRRLTSSRGPGWPLYELAGPAYPRKPTLADIANASLGALSPEQQKLVLKIRQSTDPAGELARFTDREARPAEVLVNSFGTFPTLNEIEQRLGLIDRALDHPLPEPILVHRALQEVDFMQDFGREAVRSLEGTVQTEPGYLSASLGTEAGPEIARGWSFRLHLTLPAGSRGLWIGKHSAFPEQREILQPRGLQYLITRVVERPDRKVHIHAEALPPNEAQPRQELGLGDQDLRRWLRPTPHWTAPAAPENADTGTGMPRGLRLPDHRSALRRAPRLLPEPATAWLRQPLAHYTETYRDLVDSGLLGDSVPPNQREALVSLIHRLDLAFVHTRVSRPLILHSGVDIGFLDRVVRGARPAQLVGTVHTEPGFLSASLFPIAPEDHPVELILLVPTKFPALRLGDITALLPRDTSLLIHDIHHRSGDGPATPAWTVQAEIVPTGWRPGLHWRARPIAPLRSTSAEPSAVEGDGRTSTGGPSGTAPRDGAGEARHEDRPVRGDGWVRLPDGTRRWGRYGAA
ncbi:ADP-ribosyltransferase, partial [Nocardiopsis sp. LOL_012]|uniref:ADP-ribosyltransferase n=1 Tax=Nocardiopsis sp. LOL_012 TaxID=3345409 RepID=UPI003A8516B6